MAAARTAPPSGRPGWLRPLWGLLLAGVALALLSHPVTFADSNSASNAYPIDTDGNFAGVASPSSSVWYRFNYKGASGDADIKIQFAPDDIDKLDMFVYTGSADNPRQEADDTQGDDNQMVFTFISDTDTQVFIQVKNRESDRAVAFIGTVPSSNMRGLNSGDKTPTPGPVAEKPRNAIPVAADGQFQGVMPAQNKVWWSFYYNNPNSDATITLSVAPDADDISIDVYTGSDTGNLQSQSANLTRTGNTLKAKVNRPNAQVIYVAVGNNKSRLGIAYAGSVSPGGPPSSDAATANASTATPTPTFTATATTTATVTPTPAPTNTPAPAPSVQHDTRYFSQTGYRIDNDGIWSFFNGRGDVGTFGYPVSRTFQLLSCQVQIFQRQVAQQCGGTVQLLNMLDPEYFPYTRVNGSTFPGSDQQLKDNTPRPGDPNYSTAIIDFVRANAPDAFNGQPVNFGLTFFSTVTAQQSGVSDPGLLSAFDLEIWGAPISRPMMDSANNNFIYQRFQRGIMHYTTGQGTRGVLLADYLKQIMLGPKAPALPLDLAQQAQGNRFYGQYCPGGTGWICRPSDLPNTDLTFAFEQG